MSDEKDKAGLGKIIYSVDDTNGKTPEERQAERQAREEVEEADRESFPASDAPGFSGAVVKEEKQQAE